MLGGPEKRSLELVGVHVALRAAENELKIGGWRVFDGCVK